MHYYQDKVILCNNQRTQWAPRRAGHVQARPMWEGCRTSTNSAWKMSHNRQIFFLDPYFSSWGRGHNAGAYPSCTQVKAGYIPGRACSPQGPFLTIWTFSALLKGTSALLRRCLGTFPRLPAHLSTFLCSRGLNRKRPLLSAAPHRLSYPRKYVLFKITTCFKWQITHDWCFTGD